VIGLGFLVDKFNRGAGLSIISAFFGIMFFYSSRNIGSNAGVKRSISALNYVDVPHMLLCSSCGGSARSPETSDSSLAHHHGEQGKTSLLFNRREVFPRRTMVAVGREPTAKYL